MCQRLYMHFHLVFTIILQDGQYYPYFANKESEPQRDYIIKPAVAELVLKAPKTHCLLNLLSFLYNSLIGGVCETEMLSGLLHLGLKPRSALTSSMTLDNYMPV